MQEVASRFDAEMELSELTLEEVKEKVTGVFRLRLEIAKDIQNDHFIHENLKKKLKLI